MTDAIAEYERLRQELEALSLPSGGTDRKTLWVIERLLGIAKTSRGVIELFLVGEQLRPASSLVRRHLEHGRWQVADAEILIDANRIVLPAEPHFLSLAALVGVELIRHGLHDSQSLPTVFRQVEPLIELALRRTALAEEHMLGLVGELLCLEIMLDAVIVTPDLFSLVLDMWHGPKGLRDFVIGKIGIEVKTTQLQSSSHKFSGLHQIEPNDDSPSEECVLLLSVGLAYSSIDGQSLSELVERIVQKISPRGIENSAKYSPLQLKFLADVASYGRENGSGYDHYSMAEEQMYNARLRPTFTPRLYDLSDSNVRLLRRQDLATTFVSADDLQFRIDLPAIIGPSNPMPGWIQLVSQLVRQQMPN